MRRTLMHRTLLAAALIASLAAPVFAGDDAPRHQPRNPIARFLVWIFDGLSSPPG